MAGLTTTGFETKTLEDIVQDIGDGIHSKVDPRVDVSPASPTGNFVGIIGSKLAELWELAQAVHSNQYPDSAFGFGLTSLAALTGTNRKPAFPSKAVCTLSLNGGATYTAGTLKANVTGDPLSRFHNRDDVVVVGVGAQTVTDVVFLSDDNGPVRANAGTLTVIAEALSGFNSITNPEDAVLGGLVEGDTALRFRREEELARRGSTDVEALLADLREVDGVISVKVLANDTDVTDGNGVPPHAVECIVRGGVDADVSKTIFNTKSAGTGTYGNTTDFSVPDSQGINHRVDFTRPDVIDIYLKVYITGKTATYGGDTLVKTTLADYGDSHYGAGDDVILSRLVAAIFDNVPGVDDVTSILVEDVFPPTGTTNFAIGLRELADLDTSRITVVATLT